LRDEVFTTAGALSPMAGQGDPTVLMQADAARVRILNGSFTPNLDYNTGAYLQKQGMQIVGIGPAEQAYNQTFITVYSPKLYTLKYLLALLKISSSAQIVIKPDPTSQIDIDVRLGNDWANSNTLQ
jgi:LytR cell envelope-related transcriptional attenuator